MMYAADERFKRNIDKYGEKPARFASEKISDYFKTERKNDYA